MNNAQLYLAWLRTTSPDIYLQAMRKITGQVRTLGGLDADLCQSMTAPATFGSFGQDSSSDSSLPEITVTANPDTSTDWSYSDSSGWQYQMPAVDASALTPIDTSSITNVSTPDIQITAPPAPAPSGGGSSWLSAFTTAVGNVASAALTSSNQSNLVKLNTQRAQQGLPPVDQYGRPVQSGFAPSTSAIYNLERQIAGATGGVSPMILLAGVGLLAFVLLRK